MRHFRLTTKVFLAAALLALGSQTGQAEAAAPPAGAQEQAPIAPAAGGPAPGAAAMPPAIPAAGTNPYLAGSSLPKGSQPPPELPIDPLSLLPKFQMVHPTGEKPLLVITAKCPTELGGVTLPPVKFMHDLVSAVFEVVNKADILPFDLQQVCQ